METSINKKINLNETKICQKRYTEKVNYSTLQTHSTFNLSQLKMLSHISVILLVA